MREDELQQLDPKVQGDESGPKGFRRRLEEEFEIRYLLKKIRRELNGNKNWEELEDCVKRQENGLNCVVKAIYRCTDKSRKGKLMEYYIDYLIKSDAWISVCSILNNGGTNELSLYGGKLLDKITEWYGMLERRLEESESLENKRIIALEMFQLAYLVAVDYRRVFWQGEVREMRASGILKEWYEKRKKIGRRLLKITEQFLNSHPEIEETKKEYLKELVEEVSEEIGRKKRGEYPSRHRGVLSKLLKRIGK